MAELMFYISQWNWMAAGKHKLTKNLGALNRILHGSFAVKAGRCGLCYYTSGSWKKILSRPILALSLNLIARRKGST